MKKSYLLLVIAMLPWLIAIAQNIKNKSQSDRAAFSAVFYNVENLYDTKDDPKINDNEFTPLGKIPWTDERYKTKIKNIGQVLSGITSPALPDLVGFAEIENKQVLEVLVTSGALIRINYGIVHYDSPDERGIDVALLYNPSTFKVIYSEPLKVNLPGNDPTRDILHVKGKINTGEILHVYVNHWPSRREGKELSDPKRMAAAQVLRKSLDSIQRLEKSPNILILGDFNDEPSDNSIVKGLKARRPEKDFNNTTLYNLLYPQFLHGEGSLYYKDWDMFDQVIVSGNMLTRKKGIRTSVRNAGIFRAEYLLFKNKAGDSRPNRTMGDRYYGGYSDHLPVYVKFFL